MQFERQELLLLRRRAEKAKQKWQYSGERKPGFVLACEKPHRSIDSEVFYCDTEDQWLKTCQQQTWIMAEGWRIKTFRALGINQGRIIMATTFIDQRLHREFESQLYHWWASHRQFMLGEFELIRA